MGSNAKIKTKKTEVKKEEPKEAKCFKVIFFKDHEYKKEGRTKRAKKNESMVGDPDFLQQFIDANVAYDATNRQIVTAEERNEILSKAERGFVNRF